MDFSKYIQLKQEAANVYKSRSKTVDSSFLSLQKQQKAAHSGYNDIQSIPYFNGAPVLNNTLLDKNACPADHAYTEGHTTTNRQSQQQDLALRKAGCAVCKDPDYSTVSPGVELKSYTVATATLNQYNTPMGNAKPYGYGQNPGALKPYGYGQSHFFPSPDKRTNDVYPPAAWPYH